MSEIKSTEFEDLLTYLRATHGFDFGAYKQTTLTRRVQKRMQVVESPTFGSYLDYLQVRPDEFSNLFNTILINVTGFFRDREAWDYLRDVIIPEVIERRAPRDTIRVWSAGCASGEEAYTLAILFAEALGKEAFSTRVKLYATDLDDDALQHSRQATYTKLDLEEMDPVFIEKYFEESDGKFVFNRELRRAIIFGKHDLITDAPISRVDMLICRNTLMYFNAEVQEKILARFHFALSEGGFLFLGKAETMLTHGNIFVPKEMKHRLFVRNGANARERLLTMGQRIAPDRHSDDHSHTRVRELALDVSPVAQVVVNGAGTVVLINERARNRFSLSVRDIGRPLQDLEMSYKPLELRSVIEQVHHQHRPVTIKEVAWTLHSGDVCYHDVQISPLTGAGQNVISITFTDVTDFKRLQLELLQFNQELETAYEELQSTNEELQTTNEEMQSTVEELETTNEELHSSNEELETMNEELQSSNEELETINDEMRRITHDLNQSNAFLGSVLASLRSAVIVVDSGLTVLAWNDRSRDMWGLTSDEVAGKHLLNLDIGFPVDSLRLPVRQAVSQNEAASEFEVDAINRRGKPTHCRVACAPLRSHEGLAIGAIVSIEADD